jgi:hypothetical protein
MGRSPAGRAPIKRGRSQSGALRYNPHEACGIFAAIPNAKMESRQNFSYA